MDKDFFSVNLKNQLWQDVVSKFSDKRRDKIYIYNDKGCGDVEKLGNFVHKQFSDTSINVDFINARDVWSGKLDDRVLAFFMPGGKADEYFEALWGIGNEKIREYVAGGGMYFGICAGAYYACRIVKFDDVNTELKGKGRYGLDLFNGVARGTLHKELGIAKFAKNPNSMAIVDLMDVSDGDYGKVGRIDYASLYHGGPFFDSIEGDFVPIADYVLGGNGQKIENRHAIVSSKFGAGQVILSGVHFEVGPDDLGELLPFMLENPRYLRILHDIRMKEYRRQKLLFNLMEKVRGGR